MPKSDLQREIDGEVIVPSTFTATTISSSFSTLDADAWLATKTTDNLTEGSTNEYNHVSIGVGGLSAKLAIDSSQVITMSAINHSDLSNVSANDHHNEVSIGSGGLSSKLAIATGQSLTLAAINHSDLSSISANQHVDHSTVTLTAGTGLTGGGDITSSRSFAIDYDVSGAHWTQRHYFDGGLDASDAEIYGQLHASVFVKDLLSAHAGAMIIAKSAGTLASSYTTGGTMVVKDPPSGGTLFAVNDVLRIKAESTAGVDDVWVKVTSVTSPNTYATSVLNSSPTVTFPAGTGVVDYGQSGQGLITLDADGADTPKINLETHAGAPYSSTTIVTRIGNLNGIPAYNGITPSGYGLYASKVFIADGSSITQIDGGNITANTITATQVNSDFLTLGNGAGYVAKDVSLYLPFTYAGDYRTNTNGHLGQAPVVESGSVVGFAGGKFGSGKLSLTEAFTNEITNPSFEVDLIGWSRNSSDGSFTITRDTTKSYIGDASMRIDKGTSSWGYAYHATITIADGETLSASIYIFTTSTATDVLRLYDGGTLLSSASSTKTNEWTRIAVDYTNNSGASMAITVRIDTTYASTPLYVDAVQATKTSYQLPYRDGDMPGCSWSDPLNPNNSTTIVTMSQLKYDGDNFDPTAPHSILCWAKSSAATHTAGYYTNIARYGDYYTNNSITLMWINSTTIGVYVKDNVGTWTSTTVSGLDPTVWHQFGWIRTNNAISLIVDGQVTGSITAIPTARNANDTIEVGGDSGVNGKQLNGWISDFLIGKTALSAADIKAIYDSGVPVTVPHANHELMVAGDAGNRVWLNADGLFAEADTAGTPSFALANSAVAWNGETLAEGDVLLGDNSTGKANILFDASAGTFSIRGGTTEQVQIAADGSLKAGGGVVWLDSGGVNVELGVLPSGGIILPPTENAVRTTVSGSDRGGLFFFRPSASATTTVVDLVAGGTPMNGYPELKILNETSEVYVAILNAPLGLPELSAPATSTSSLGLIYIDSADGDLKVKFANGTVKTIATN